MSSSILALCPHTGMPLRPASHPALVDFGLSPGTGAVHYLKARALAYDDDYFLTEYKTQYGRTYVEDEPNLRRLARRRLALLPEIAPTRSAHAPRLLEIGCACGFFLDEARQVGYATEGLEISPYAATFARQQLKLDVRQGSFLEHGDGPRGPFDVVAAFFVLEHFAAQAGAFRKIAELLRPGGLLLFALPSTRGPLFECSPETWARTHPPRSTRLCRFTGCAPCASGRLPTTPTGPAARAAGACSGRFTLRWRIYSVTVIRWKVWRSASEAGSDPGPGRQEARTNFLPLFFWPQLFLQGF